MNFLRRNLFLLFLFLSISIGGYGQGKNPTLVDLDHEIASMHKYDKAYEEGISKLRKLYFTALSPKQQFVYSSQLFDRYSVYNIDSAMIYANRKLSAAQLMDDVRGMDDAQLNIIYMMIKGGQLKDASDMFTSIDKDKLPHSLRSYYFSTLKTYYDGLAEASLQPSLHAQYTGWSEIITDSIVALSRKPDIWTLSDQLMNRHQNEKAKEILLDAYNKLPFYNRHIGFIAYNLSKIYGIQADSNKQKRYLIASAISDIRNSVKEHLALQELALILFQEGDTEHAYKYMDQALKDVVACNARQRTLGITYAWPVIQKSYEARTRKSMGWLTISLVTISILFVFLLLFVIFIRKKLKELEDTRGQVNATNQLLKESNTIKDQYITEFLIQCSSYIDKIDAFRRRALRLFTSGKRNELSALLKSQEVVDEELENFYANFDYIFLGLFPEFITEFNRLLQPNEAILPKQEGRLSTDLRIYALIRLGVSENDLISSFLRCSKATVYAYRSRIRLKSIDPDHFDEQVKHIKGHM